MNLEIQQKARYTDEDLWSWSVWLEGPESELDNIDFVLYTLHRSFPNPVRKIKDRASKYCLKEEGWLPFTIYVEISFKDGEIARLEHNLEFKRQVEPAKHILSERVKEKLSPSPKKKLLTIEGGGIRSLISIEILQKIENLLRAELGGGKDFRLCEYFDYVAGTSSGAIIATCLSWGMSVEEIRKFYRESGEEMFDKASLLKRFRHMYEDKKISKKLQDFFGKETTLGSSKLKTLLMMVVRNATTDLPWFLSNNPRAKYNDRSRFDCNLDIPLWQIIRASTALPIYFPPEVIRVGSQDFVFTDGGISTYNNPAFQLFLMATAEPYRLEWPGGEEKLLLVSVGSGFTPLVQPELSPADMNLAYNAASLPSALMSSALLEQDLLCRMFGRCRAGFPLNGEVGDMIGRSGPIKPKLFTYVRYTPQLDLNGIRELGLSGEILPNQVQPLDSVQHINKVIKVGEVFAERHVRTDHFEDFLTVT